MIICFEKLTVPKLFFAIAAKSVFWKTEALYPEASFCAQKTLGFLKFARIFRWIRFYDFTIGVTMKNGESLRYKAEEMTTISVDTVFKELFFEKNYIPNYLDKHLKHVHAIIKSYLVYLLRQKVYFLCSVNHISQIEDFAKNKRIRCFLNYIPAFSVFKDSMLHNTDVSFYNWMNIFSFIRERIPINAFLMPIGKIKAFFFNSKQYKKIYQQLASDPKSKVFVEFFKKRFLNDIHSHLFWFPESGISADRVVMGFDREDSPASSQNIKLVEDYGMRWLDLRMKSMHNHIKNPFYLTIRNLFEAPLPRNIFNSGIWRWKIIFEMSYFLQVWREIIKKYNIKAFHQHHEHTFTSNIQSLAVKMEGGMFFWFHWSVGRYPVAHFNSGCCDVFFSWGKLHSDYIEMHNFDYSYMVDVGCVWDCSRMNESLQNEDGEVKIGNSFNFIITIFDAGNGLWTQISPSMEGLFYEDLLELVLKHLDWAVIIKSKGTRHLGSLPNSKKVARLIKQLKSENRCFLPPPSKGRSLHESAKAADICVGLGISSPCVISGLNECKAIHWDLSGNNRHPFYLDGEERIIFKGKEDVTEILEKLASKENGMDYIGDHSPWFYMLDSYRDNKAGLRAGKFIKFFLSEIDSGKDRDSAIKNAAEEHGRKWGENTVHSFDLKGTRLNDNIWLKAEKVLKK